MSIIRITVGPLEVSQIAHLLEQCRGNVECQADLTLRPHRGFHYAQVSNSVVAGKFIHQLRGRQMTCTVVPQLPSPNVLVLA